MRLPARSVRNLLNKGQSSKEIRKKFLDFFINENGHNFVRSSPVVPFCDPTVAFVNAGMNQFKSILQGKQVPQHRKVVNSQKCVRVGGKHNDLDIVGTDGYHHTFFEMLGNWSFGDYFKKEACEMAWKLLTDVYKLPPTQLYVTYFKGDLDLGIEEDLETKEIWKSLGIPENRILSFDMKENFWEMGPVGPCGPSTEIHYDHMGPINRATFVNKGLHDLTELWNIVFIQYNRNTDGTLSPLPHKHVDTGLGFERLTSILQGRVSNYDTDNFAYIIKAIQKICSDVPRYRGTFGERDWNSLDMSYRILSDHARTITACLADGIIPEQNQKFRRLLRKALLLSETTFKKEQGLLMELSKYVAENLGPVYPEIERNMPQVIQILNYEEAVFKELRKSACVEWNRLTADSPSLNTLDVIETPSIIAAYKEVRKRNPSSIDGQFAFKLYDTFGLDEKTMIQFAQALNMKLDKEGFEKEMAAAKARSKNQGIAQNDTIVEQLLKEKIKKTDDKAKYEYKKENKKYVYKNVDVQVLKIICNNEFVPEVGKDMYCSLVLDKTNLYTESGGQASDKGTINFKENLFQVFDAENRDGYILHKGFLQSCPANFKLQKDSKGTLAVHEAYRFQNMQNHTATHLLNKALKVIKGATCQKSSKVTDLYVNLDVGIFGSKLAINEIEKIEDIVKKVIKSSTPVVVKNTNSQELLSLDGVTLIPGEVYPESNIRLIEISDKNFVSREPCCGTHVFNTSDLQDFCVIKCKSLGRSTMSIYAVTGDRAQLARNNGTQLLDNILALQRTVDDNIDKPEVLELAISSLKRRLKFSIESKAILPVVVNHQCLERLTSISKQIKDTAKNNLREFIDIEMKNVLESNVLVSKNNHKYILHYLRSSMLLETVPLQKATRLCPDLPVLIIAFSDNMVKARCCVPKELVKKNFSAEKWLKDTVASIFKSPTAPPKGQDSQTVCNMKPKKINMQDWDTLLNDSMNAAKQFVEENL